MAMDVNSSIPAWLEEPPRQTIQPPVVTKVQDLPFDQLLWENFERLCLRLIRLEAEVEHCQLYGERGQNQKGIDIYAKLNGNGTYQTWQCKRERNFSPAKIRTAVKKFLAGDWADKSSALVLCTIESLVATERADELEAQRALLRAKQINLQVWDSHQLSMKLKDLPGIVTDFFGIAWANAFCGEAETETTAPRSSEISVTGGLQGASLVQGNENTVNITYNYYPESKKENADITTQQAAISSPSASSNGGTFAGARTTSVENLFAVLNDDPKPIWLLGGGASIRSGIPLSAELAEKAARWEYCRRNGRLFEDTTLRRSDYLKWLQRECPQLPALPGEQFRYLMRHLLLPRDNRREFLLHIVNSSVRASSGYERFVELMISKTVLTVLTTSFDSKLHRLCLNNPRLHHHDLIDHSGSYRQLTTSPRVPRIVQLYGTLDDYIDRFEGTQEDSLQPNLVHRLVPLLRDHPLIVVGYGGAEEAVMRHLLIEQIEEADYFQHGIFWCVADFVDGNEAPPLVRELASLIRGHFQVVPIRGFDELMETLWASVERRRPAMIPVPALPNEVKPAPTFDMESIAIDSIKELDWPSLQSRIIGYCERWRLDIPAVVTREWLIDQLCSLDLAVKESGQPVQPTKAGFLLFGKKPQDRIPVAQVLMRVNRDGQILSEVVKGNLWAQLGRIIDTLADFNRPFLLKGEKHESVYPYPPRALREVVVNALVHRDYDEENNVVIEIEPDSIRILNPGGLVEEVWRQTAENSLLKQIEQGKRGIKGYRNPVIADLFYGSRDMEKEGSGLADVHRLVTNNGGKVVFGPVKENAAFEVILYSRPEAVDKQTGTAAVVTSTRYAANLLEVEGFPAKIWQAPTIYTRGRDVWAATDAPWLPPFILYEKYLHTFYDLSKNANPLKDLVDKTAIQWVPLEAFFAGADGERRFVWLINECLYQHLKNCGLIVDPKRKRAYFPRTESGNRSITYQARLRRSSRTVTKQIISPSTQKIRYWEHQSLSFSFERFGDTWALHLVPGYVFTRDGYKDLLTGERVNVLSTKRASRDYNNKVHTDLIFWTWILSNGEQGSIALSTGPTPDEWKSIKTSASVKSALLRAVRKQWSKLNAYEKSAMHPRLTLSSSLPTLTIYSLEDISDEQEAGERERIEMEEFEEELATLAEEFEERFYSQ